MSVLVGELLQDAYLFAGIGDQYNPVDADSTNLALRFLNDLADSFSTDALKIFNVTDLALPLISGTQSYSIGQGQPVSMQPVAIDSISILDAQGVSHPVKMINGTEWQSLVFKAAPGRPNLCYVNFNNTTVDLLFWPLESFANDVAHLFVWTDLNEFTSVGNVFNAPAGYRLFFKTALAKVLASINKVALSKDQNDVIAAAELTMKARNGQRRILDMDVPQDSTVRGRFNIFTGYPR